MDKKRYEPYHDGIMFPREDGGWRRNEYCESLEKRQKEVINFIISAIKTGIVDINDPVIHEIFNILIKDERVKALEELTKQGQELDMGY